MEEKDTMELDLEGWVGSISGGDGSLQPLPPSASSFPGTIEMERGLQTDRNIDIGRRSRYESRYRGNVRSARLHDLAVEKGLRPRIGEERINDSTVITGTPIVRRYRRDVDLKDADWKVLPNEITDQILSSLDPLERRRVSLVSPEWGSYAPTIRYFEDRILSKELTHFFREVSEKEEEEEKWLVEGIAEWKMRWIRERKVEFYRLIASMLREMVREMGFDIPIRDDRSEGSTMNEFDIGIGSRHNENYNMMIYVFNARGGLGIRTTFGLSPVRDRSVEKFPKDIIRIYPYIRHVLKAFERYGLGTVHVSTRDVDVHFLAESHPLAYQFGVSRFLTERSRMESLVKSFNK